MACTCQECGDTFTMDVIVSDDIWALIKPDEKPEGAGLLCPSCIVRRIESLHEHSAYRLTRVDATN